MVMVIQEMMIRIVTVIPNYLESSLLDQDDDGVVDQFDSVDDDPL